MVAAARARTPLLGPSGPACAMEMSYHIHSSPKGNPPVQPRSALPAPCSPHPRRSSLGCPARSLTHPGTGQSPPCLPAFAASPSPTLPCYTVLEPECPCPHLCPL